jgi:hypothetical protein
MAELYDELEADEGFYADAPAGFKQMYLDTMFPSTEILARCAVMRDFGELYEAMNEMWATLRQAKS